MRRLRILKAVVDTGSVSGAAAALGYTSSAISQQVTALERETDTVLFERAGRGVRPTDAALLLSEHAARVLATLHETEEALASLRAGRIGRIRLGAFPTAGSTLVPAALAAFQRLHPNVALDLVVAETEDAVAALRSGSLDIAVALQFFGESGMPDDGLVYEHLLSDPFRVVIPRQHRLASRRSVDLVDLAQDRWVSIKSCPGYCQRVADEACVQAGFRPTYALEADEYPTAQGFVAAGLGVALVPMLALGSVHPGVVVRRIRKGDWARELWLATRPAIAEHLPIRAMLGCLHDAAGQLVDDHSGG
ncbi:MAG: LysR family transcriptional regulator [Acidimicrobiaceae bacterium]|nr:LysR family transcriptional regulator [Acidimicrobiaceae bacterium]